MIISIIIAGLSHTTATTEYYRSQNFVNEVFRTCYVEKIFFNNGKFGS